MLTRISSIEQKEVAQQNSIRYEANGYASSAIAKRLLSVITKNDTQQMAKIYQEAFAGPPWFEVYRCSSCGNFSREATSCSYCSGIEFSQAYPIEKLIKNYFPEMLASYAPGVLIFARNGENEIQGFTTGGAIKLKDLIEKKYRGNKVILSSIVTNTGVKQGETVFYENETCVSPTKQQRGLGGNLNYQRIVEAANRGYKYICGRSVNLPWIELKKRQFRSLGYGFVAFYPDGDDYSSNGQRRYFFMAQKGK